MKYRNMSYLFGEEIELKEPPRKNHDDEFYYSLDRIIVVDEYPKTLLIRKYYGKNSYLRMLTKASMFCGDVQVKHGTRLLIGKEVVRR